MKSLLISLSILISIAMVTPFLIGQTTTNTITLKNRSGMDIYHVTVSPSGQNQWSSNKLEGTFMGYYMERKITLSDGLYDLKFEDFNKEMFIIKTGVQVSSDSEIVLVDSDWRI